MEPQETPEIPPNEIRITFSRSGGPGGQNVNKVSTRATVELDLEASQSFTPEQKEKLRSRLASRVNSEGVLRVTSQKYRTQSANREAALQRLRELIAGALREAKPRRKTRVPRAVREQRLIEKRRRAEIKKGRSGAE